MGTIRRMDRDDVEDSISVFVASFEDAWNRYERDYYPRKALEFDFSRMTPENYKKRIQELNHFLFVAEEDGKLVGAAVGEIMRGNDKEGGLALLGSICIHPSHQRKGLGEALLNHILEHCRHQKCHKITLYTLPVLVPALNLYLKLGFRPKHICTKSGGA